MIQEQLQHHTRTHVTTFNAGSRRLRNHACNGRLELALVGLLEDISLGFGGAVGGDGAGEGGLHLLGGEGVLAVGHRVQQRGGSLAEERAVAVGPGVGQRVVQGGVAAEDGGAAVAEEIAHGAQGPDDGDDGIGVRTPVSEDRRKAMSEVEYMYSRACRWQFTVLTCRCH